MLRRVLGPCGGPPPELLARRLASGQAPNRTGPPSVAQTSRSSCAFPSAGGVSRVRLRDTCPTDDQAKRLVALKTAQGEQVSDAVKNLDQVKLGDVVEVSYSAGMAGE